LGAKTGVVSSQSNEKRKKNKLGRKKLGFGLMVFLGI
jgi:hypothetical protein